MLWKRLTCNIQELSSAESLQKNGEVPAGKEDETGAGPEALRGSVAVAQLIMPPPDHL